MILHTVNSFPIPENDNNDDNGGETTADDTSDTATDGNSDNSENTSSEKTVNVEGSEAVPKAEFVGLSPKPFTGPSFTLTAGETPATTVINYTLERIRVNIKSLNGLIIFFNKLIPFNN